MQGTRYGSKHISQHISNHCILTFCSIPADCGDPSLPMNGFVMAYNSTLEGSQIVFQCNPGFAPSQQMMSVCMADGIWTPNPAGLVPVGVTTAVCMENGKWTPDPEDAGCRLPGQCLN